MDGAADRLIEFAEAHVDGLFGGRQTLSMDDHLLDRPALRVLSCEYAAAADSGDVARFLSVFTLDGTLTVPGPPEHTLRGQTELAVVPGLLSRYHRTFHLVGQGTYRQISNGSAVGEVYCVAHHVERVAGGDTDMGTDKVMYLRYQDEYSDSETGWRISHRTLDVRWTDHQAVHLTPGSNPDLGP